MHRVDGVEKSDAHGQIKTIVETGNRGRKMQLDKMQSEQNSRKFLAYKRRPADNAGSSEMVGVERFELPTSCSQSRRATRLRYTPICLARVRPPPTQQRRLIYQNDLLITKVFTEKIEKRVIRASSAFQLFLSTPGQPRARKCGFVSPVIKYRVSKKHVTDRNSSGSACSAIFRYIAKPRFII